MIRIVLFIASLLLAPSWAGAAPREVEVTATGLSTREAIASGLVMAMEQVQGVAIASSTVRREIAMHVNAEASSVGEERANVLLQQTQTETRRLTGGWITGYRVLSSTETAPFTVTLLVSIDVFQPVGPSNETRRRIAVLPFEMVPRGPAKRTAPLVETMRDRISAHLVQARRFAVVDRAQEGAYREEMRLLQADAPMAERLRLGQVIGADYVVTGKLRNTAAARSDRTIELTGEVVTSTTQGSAEVDYQVIEIATRQVKWAATARIAGADAADRVAAKIAQDIVQTIYPMRLIRFDNPANLVINQGGDSLKAGQRYRAMRLGEAVIDPYTKESLGQMEEETGIVEVRRVDPKLSYAQLVSGRLPAAAEGVEILLRSAPAAAVAAVPRRGGGVPGPAVVKLPGDP